jgi:hypothetical protein
VRKNETDNQLSLALSASDDPKPTVTAIETAQIVPFVDAATLRTRATAINQLARGGVFRVPEGLQRFVN